MARRLVLLAAAALLVFALPGFARPPAAVSDCRLVVDGPFLYLQADLVIPDSYFECTAEQQRITISSVLTRDGVQVWCVTATGSVGRQAFGPATACESAEF